jgi:sporulation protein YlmC with PRC-barrel domain
MVSVSGIEGLPLTGAGGAVLGTVTNVLFHPSEPRVVGVAVRPPNALAVVARPGTYLPLSALTFDEAGARADLVKLPFGGEAATGLGYDPDVTVIWTGMAAKGPRGTQVGFIRDVVFDESSGAVERLAVAGGAIADATCGLYLVPSTEVEGYRDGAVHVTADIADLDDTGGLAKKAAASAVVAGQMAHAAGEAVVGASGATGRAIRAVADSDISKRAADRAKRTWRDTAKAFREGMKGDE